MESGYAEGLPAHRRLGGMSTEGPDEARAVVRMKGTEDFISHPHLCHTVDQLSE